MKSIPQQKEIKQEIFRRISEKPCTPTELIDPVVLALPRDGSLEEQVLNVRETLWHLISTDQIQLTAERKLQTAQDLS